MSSFLAELTLDIFMPLLAAACLGGIVGWERESWQKPAGLRTHMMVALGAATFTLVALRVLTQGQSVDMDGGDPSRIIEGVATGIGFLGAGSIIQSQGKIRGITTAAGVWVVGGVGACCGARQYQIAAVAVLLSVVILAVLPKIEANVLSDGQASQD